MLKRAARDRDDVPCTGVALHAAVAEGIAAARASKQAKRVDDIWGQLRAQSGGSASTSAPSSAQNGSGAPADAVGANGSTAPAQPHRQQGGKLNLAAFCRPVPRKQKGVPDEVSRPNNAPVSLAQQCEKPQETASFYCLAQSWKRQFGVASQPQPKAGGQQDAKAIAAAALEAAKAIATTDQYGRAVVTETRKFAGQSVQVRRLLPGAACGSAAGACCHLWRE